MNSIKSFTPRELHGKLLDAVTPALAFDAQKDFFQQKATIKNTLEELVRVPKRTQKGKIVVEYTDESDARFDEIRFCFESEENFFVPAHLLLPKKRKEKLPLVICLQGHSPGMHVSLAREPYPSKKPIAVEGDRDFCLQAIEQGYAALAIEQRGFGELGYNDSGNDCHVLAWQAALVGRTLIGERVCDISSAIDAVIANFPVIDSARIGATGNSGGGTASYFAACFDERIKVCMPSSSFCSFADAWGKIYHCDCGYVPRMLEFMEMSDMAALIAPRPLIVVNGILDHLQPFDAAKSAFEKVKEIYEAAHAKDNCAMVVGNEGHRFYADLAWKEFKKYI